MRALVVTTAMVAGCIHAPNPTCGTLTCPTDDVCSTDLQCVAPDQLAACGGLGSGSSCTFGDLHGFCHDEVCVVSLDTCGDGVSELALGELCDCGTSDLLAAPPTGCTGFNSNDPGATCRPDCMPARCGDSILDPSELCDDGNTVSGDGCRADCQGPFEKMETPTGNALTGVATLSATDAYAVGVDGTMIHYDGTAWSNVDVPTNANLDAIYAVSPTDIYVAGGSGSLAGLIHFDGTSWVEVPVGATGELGGVWASSASDIYVISAPSGPAEIAHFNGTSWSAVTDCSGRPTAIAGTGPSSVYIATATGLCWFNGTKWSYIYGDAGLVARVSTTEVVSVSALTPQTLRLWTGSATGPLVSIPGTAFAIGGAGSSDELFAIGASGLVLELDPSSAWTHLVTPTELQLSGISATSPTNVFIVGASGVVLH